MIGRVIVAALVVLLAACVAPVDGPEELHVERSEPSPANGCDDGNPCTVDAPTRDGGCEHASITTPEGQANACFPALDTSSPEPGRCVDGACRGDQ